MEDNWANSRCRNPNLWDMRCNLGRSHVHLQYARERRRGSLTETMTRHREVVYMVEAERESTDRNCGRDRDRIALALGNNARVTVSLLKSKELYYRGRLRELTN